MWINELKSDFPEYLEIIELIDWEVEQFLELLEDYYFCKQQIKMLVGEDQSIPSESPSIEFDPDNLLLYCDDWAVETQGA